MNAILRHSVFPRSCSFQVENTSLKLDEYVGISQIMESSIITWAIIMCTFRIFAHMFGYGTHTRRNLLRIFLAAY